MHLIHWCPSVITINGHMIQCYLLNMAGISDNEFLSHTLHLLLCIKSSQLQHVHYGTLFKSMCQGGGGGGTETSECV